MHGNSKDKTIARNYANKWQFLMEDYELIKAGKHPRLKSVAEFCEIHHTNRQTLAKYYNRYKQEGIGAFEARKRGRPRYTLTADNDALVARVLEAREDGHSRYGIYAILKRDVMNRELILKEPLPSVSTIYRICKRFGKERLTKKMRANYQSIVKDKPGQLAQGDVFHLGRDWLLGSSQRYYLVGIIDACTRIVGVEVISDMKSLSVMFASLKIINWMSHRYGIQFQEFLSDNGAEFASRNNVMGHPFERMLQELGIKHRYTRPYRPQTNGKIERFWRTLNEELIHGATFETIDEFRDELERYLLYYNEYRMHQGIGGMTPKERNDSVSELVS